MADGSKQQEALKDAEAAPQPPPPAYEASVSGSDDYQVVEKSQQISVDNKKDAEHNTLPNVTPGEKRDPKHDTLPTVTKVEQLPTLPQRPKSVTSFEVPLNYTFSWRRPLLDRPTLSITPKSGAQIHSTVSGIPSISHWRLNYQAKYFARLHRYTAEKEQGDFPFMQTAEVKFPEFIWPGCGPTIKFEPHEEEIARRGSKHVSRTDKFMHCTGWFSTKYGIDLPVLQHSRVVWTAVKPKYSTIAEVEGGVKTSQPTVPKASDTRLITMGDIVEQAKKTINDDTWTPYSKQQLVEEKTGRIVATYSRAAPWSSRAGELVISPLEGAPTTPEYVEGVIIACAAMVGMQDRIGLASALLEASTESFTKRSKKGKRKTTTEPATNDVPENGNLVARSE